jgi:hypothetical protein
MNTALTPPIAKHWVVLGQLIPRKGVGTNTPRNVPTWA